MQMMQRRAVMRLGLGSAGLIVIGRGAAAESSNPMPDELREAIERQPFAPVLGNPKGDVTLTEFFDYNCPYCRSSVPVLQKLIAADPKLRVVLREWPIFGEGSLYAAQASLATLKQGKYWEFHSRLMAIRGRAEEASVLAVARKAGVDVARMQKEMNGPDVLEHLERSESLGDHMGLAGTPTFIAGHDGAFGGQSLTDLQALVAGARRDLL